ncbi:unnamed protein product, partial [Laminaria digitata]
GDPQLKNCLSCTRLVPFSRKHGFFSGLLVGSPTCAVYYLRKSRPVIAPPLPLALPDILPTMGLTVLAPVAALSRPPIAFATARLLLGLGPCQGPNDPSTAQS